MCKDCQYYFGKFTEAELRVDLERHKKPHGYSGYPGKSHILLQSIDDKETIQAIINAAEKEGFDYVVKLGNYYMEELQQAVLSCLGLPNNLAEYYAEIDKP